MINLKGDRSLKMREGRARLSVRDPHVDKLLAGLIIDESNIDAARRFGNRLQADARRWMARGGLAERGRITKRDAHQMFALAFKEMRL
jgi:hypothetical protein